MKICPHCGTHWEDDCCFCQRCGAPLPPPPPPYGAAPVPPPRPVYPGAPSGTTYLVFSILATLLGCFFCFPLASSALGGSSTPPKSRAPWAGAIWRGPARRPTGR